MKYCYENAKNIEKILKIDFEVKRLASFNLTKIIMRDLDVKPTPSRDLDIKRDYQLILRVDFLVKVFAKHNLSL